MPSSLVSAVVLHAGRSGFHTRIFEVLEFLWRGVRIIQRRRDMANEYPHADGGTDVFCVAGVQREGHFSFYFSCSRHGVITGHFVNVTPPATERPTARNRRFNFQSFFSFRPPKPYKAFRRLTCLAPTSINCQHRCRMNNLHRNTPFSYVIHVPSRRLPTAGTIA
jgi:hypothetical protein